MMPTLAIVGRPNVGKSTLFNCLTRSRQALVADEPGLTRDRQYGVADIGERRCVVVDTGGLTGHAERIDVLIGQQARAAMAESEIILFVVDARQGLLPDDDDIACELRKLGLPVVLVVNKAEGLEPDIAIIEFSRLGFDKMRAVSAAHRRGMRALGECLQALLPPPLPAAAVDSAASIKVAVIGRPNVGKSTLVNRLVGEQRVVTHDSPGTTRDSVHIPLRRDGRDFILVDTAGVRRRAKVHSAFEKFSVIKSLQAIDEADVVLFLVDGREGVTDQDSTLLGHVLAAGRALVVGINKWDGLDAGEREQVRAGLSRKLRYVDYVTFHFVSALHGSGIGAMFRSVLPAYRSATRDMATPLLTRILESAVSKQPPPLVRGRRVKLRYAHQGGVRPPRIVIHGNQTDALPNAYRRYLSKFFRTELELSGTPVEIELRTGDNPFKGRRNTLTRRQRDKRKRLMRHVKT